MKNQEQIMIKINKHEEEKRCQLQDMWQYCGSSGVQ